MIVKETSRPEARPKMDPEKWNELIKKTRKAHETPVKGMFEFLDAQGGWLDFSYRFFKGPIYTIRLTHGEICELPMGIVKHLNNTKKKVRKFGSQELDPKFRGVPQAHDVISRVRFTPMDVM